MSILTDFLIDAKADLCWNHQQQQLKKEVEIDCICAQLADMIYLTRQEIAKEFEFRADETYYDEKEIWLEAAGIARGQK